MSVTHPTTVRATTTEPEITDEQPKNPAWDEVRSTCEQLRFAGRMFLRGQVKLGMLLAALKKDHSQHGGDRQKQVAESATWSEMVVRETGYSRRHGDEFIRLYDATVAKLKKSKNLALPDGAKKSALAIFQSENPLTLSETQWQLVDEVIGTLTSGETQASLMVEAGILPKPPKMPKPKPSAGDDNDGSVTTAGQLAFEFFGTIASPLINARSNPDYRKLLAALPMHSDSEHPLSLATLEQEARAFLADIEEAQRLTAKPAKGSVIA